MATTIGTEYDHIDITNGIGTIRHPLKDSSARELAQNLIKVQNAQPESDDNVLWVKETPENEVEVPTYDEFNELKSAITFYDKVTSIPFEYGGIYNGSNVSATNRIRTVGYLKSYAGMSISVPSTVTYAFVIAEYDNNKAYKLTSSWGRNYTVVNDGYIRIVMRLAGTDPTISDNDFEPMISSVTLLYDFVESFNDSYDKLNTVISASNATANDITASRKMLFDGYYTATYTDEVINNNQTTGASVNVDTPTASVGYGSIVIKNIPKGSKFRVFASGTYSLRFWSWVTGDGKMIENAASWASSGANGYDVTAPQDNCILVSSGSLTPAYGFKVQYLGAANYTRSTIEADEQRISALEGLNNKIIASQGKVIGIAHRGYMAVAPENTAAAFIAAAKAGFTTIETDIRFTADDPPVPVLIHDATVDRTSDGTGNVADKTLEQLKALDFGSWFNSSFAGEKILTLDEGIALCKKLGLKMVLEIKEWAAVSTERGTIVGIVNKYDYKDNVAFMYDNVTGLVNIASASTNSLKDVGVILLISDTGTDTPANITTLKNATDNVYVSINYTNLTSAKAETIISNGAKIIIWTVDTESPIKSMDGGVYGVLSGTYNAPVVLYNDAIN